MEQAKAEELVRRLAVALRGRELYSPTHPLVQRTAEAFSIAALDALESAPSVIIGFVGDELVVDAMRLSKATATLVGFARDLRERDVDKMTLARGLTPQEIGAFIALLGEHHSDVPLPDQLTARGIRHVTLGKIIVDEVKDQESGIAAAQRVYMTAVEAAEALWHTVKAGDQPDPDAARKIIDGLARLVTHDRTSLMALTALKQYNNYTFTHMVNVSALAMAQARALNLNGTLLREFGFAALMHDIGKVNTPVDILNKPEKLTPEEFEIMKRHVVDGAHILRRTPEMPALAPIVAFEHHLKQDLSGYPEKIGSRKLNLCTMIVSIADVFDALRSNRPYRHGLATERIRAIMAQQDSPAFNPVLLKRFVNLMGLFPVGTLVRLSSDELAVVTAEHPTDPFRPQVTIIVDAQGDTLDEPLLANTWDRDSRGEHPRAVVEAVDSEPLGIDPLKYLR